MKKLVFGITMVLVSVGNMTSAFADGTGVVTNPTVHLYQESEVQSSTTAGLIVSAFGDIRSRKPGPHGEEIRKTRGIEMTLSSGATSFPTELRIRAIEKNGRARLRVMISNLNKVSDQCLVKEQTLEFGINSAAADTVVQALNDLTFENKSVVLFANKAPYTMVHVFSTREEAENEAKRLKLPEHELFLEEIVDGDRKNYQLSYTKWQVLVTVWIIPGFDVGSCLRVTAPGTFSSPTQANGMYAPYYLQAPVEGEVEKSDAKNLRD